MIQAVILAAGQGTRMKSSLPKVLHSLAGKPLLKHVIDTAHSISTLPPIVIYGHQGERLKAAFAETPVLWVEQKEQAGTGHAVLQALPKINDSRVLVLYGDVPLISVATLTKLINATPENSIGMLTAELGNPKGYGRIKRDASNNIIGIVEEKDATDIERAITEINPGIYLLPADFLKKWLPNLKNNNAQKEYYLTDIISLAVQEKMVIHSVKPDVLEEILGVNDRMQLAHLERFHQREQAENLMREGVTIYDPSRLDIRGTVKTGRDITIDVNVILEDNVVIGDNCKIGANVILRNVQLADGVEVKENTVIEDAKIGPGCIVGPFARIRPGTVLDSDAHIGNFVEVKNSKIGIGTKVNHLSYIGDSEIGRAVNIGAGTITCNYDGANKHKTIIGDNVHVGSDTQLIAPVTVGEGATIAAGSTVTKDVAPGELTLTHRLEQRAVTGWKRPKK